MILSPLSILAKTGIPPAWWLALCIAAVAGQAKADDYEGSTYGEVWGEVTSTPYSHLPTRRVTVRSFFDKGANQLFSDSVRTIDDRSDLLPEFDKLLHPNGICLSGTWVIDQPTPYTGYFAQGSQALIISRASVALSETDRGDYRGFGFTGKLFPTTDPTHTQPLETANFFTIDNLSGTLTPHFLDTTLKNEPDRFSPGGFGHLAIGIVSAISLRMADGGQGIRQVYQISELGVADPARARTPQWMNLRASPGQIRVNERDFRDELEVSRYPGGQLFFDIYVSTPESTSESKDWLKIGYILFDDSIVSEGCDHRLHFHHPPFKEIRSR